MFRTESWITRLEAGEKIDWQRENLLLSLDMLRQTEHFITTLIQRDTQADDHYEQRHAR